MRAAAVRVPSSTSNLGPGFDALGLALSPGLVARFEPGPGKLEVEWRGTLAGSAATPDEDLAVRAFTRALRSDLAPSGRLTLDSEIPVARGLGSSAAARVAGAYLAAAVMGERPDARAILRRVAAEEGHPDNAVPAVLGGFRVATYDHDRLVSTALPLSPEVGLVFVDPGIEIRTEDARRVLPTDVPMVHATRTAARVAMLVQGLARADGELIALGLSDVLHVPFRLPLLPGAAEAVEAGCGAGAWGVTLSGSGSGLIAFTPLETLDAVCEGLVTGFRSGGQEGARAYGELIALGLSDVLHVPFRLPLLPGAAEAVEAGCGAGAWGVTLSGSGSGLIAFTPLETLDAVCEGLVTGFRSGGQEGARAYLVRPDLQGARVLAANADTDADGDRGLNAGRRLS